MKAAGDNESAGHAHGWEFIGDSREAKCISMGGMFRPLRVGQLESASPVKKEVGLFGAIAPKVEVPTAPPVRLSSTNLTKDKSFPEGSDQRRDIEIGSLSNTVEE